MELTETVRQYIVSRIIDGTYGPGASIPTELEMTRMTSTSRVTVRRAYAQLEKSGIIVRRQKSGSRVAEAFRGNSGEFESIAVISTLRDPFARDFIEEIQLFCKKNDILTILSIAETSKEQEEETLRLVAKGVRDLVFWGCDRSLDFDIFARARVLGVNLVFFDRVVPGSFADFVGLDNHHAIESIIDAARKKHCDSLGFVNYADLEVDSNQERQETFLVQCDKHGISHTIFNVPYNASNGQYPITDILKEFKKKAKPAIVGVNDRVAIRLKQILPAHFDIYGVDGTSEAISTGVASYSQPIRTMASAAVEALVNQRKLGARWRAQEFRFTGSLMNREAS